MMSYVPRVKGQPWVVYGLILILVLFAVCIILALLGPATGNLFSELGGPL